MSSSAKGKDVSMSGSYQQHRVKPPVLNQEMFMNILQKLHSEMGTKFMVPTMGGKELDLHRLFVEVASRGGSYKVVGDRSLRDVTAVFGFPVTAKNAFRSVQALQVLVASL